MAVPRIADLEEAFEALRTGDRSLPLSRLELSHLGGDPRDPWTHWEEERNGRWNSGAGAIWRAELSAAMRVRKVLARRGADPGYCNKSAANFRLALSRQRHSGRLSLAWQLPP